MYTMMQTKSLFWYANDLSRLKWVCLCRETFSVLGENKTLSLNGNDIVPTLRKRMAHTLYTTHRLKFASIENKSVYHVAKLPKSLDDGGGGVGWRH